MRHGFAQPRLEGVRQACTALGLAEPLVVTVPLSPDGGGAAVQEWRNAQPTITGICAYNDEVALSVLGAAQRAALDVPRDLAVIGVDNIPVAAVTVPALTTVQPDTTAISRHIADTIIRKLNGRSTPRWPGSPTHSVVRRDSA